MYRSIFSWIVSSGMTITITISTTFNTRTAHSFSFVDVVPSFPRHSRSGPLTTTNTPRWQSSSSSSSSQSSSFIEFQSELFGRGDRHLSAMLEEGDVVVYQSGTWNVDGVVVGDDDTQPPSFHYCQIDTIQVVWTHNCEHGVLRGMALQLTENMQLIPVDDDDDHLLEMVEFGPEQLVARIPVKWSNNQHNEGCSVIGTLLVEDCFQKQEDGSFSECWQPLE